MSYKQESRQGWGAVAGGWSKHMPGQRDAWMPFSVAMIDQARLHPGAQVLELAAGTGELGLMAHELIQPGGELLFSDFAPEMLSAAQQAAEGLEGVRFKQIDIESIDLAAASQDTVLCRWGLMFLEDPEAGVREIRRVLRPGGRFVTAAWTTPEENPWSSVVARVLGEVPEPGAPGQFALGGEGRLLELLEGAGFVEDVTVEAVELTMTETFGDWWTRTTEMSRLGSRVAGREDELRAALAPWTADDGMLHLPARTWVAAATA